MNKRLLEIYALSVCFVSMGCLSIFFGIFLYSIVEISFPSTMISSSIFYPPPPFSQSGVMTFPAIPGQPLQVVPLEAIEKNNSDQNKQLQKEKERFQNLAVERMKAESIMSIIRSLIVVFIASTVFFFHWGIAKQARADNDI